ncbi:TonB-dependent receptor plug domain-containing protein [Alteromonas sp. CYL-A6]|uniref:TonB-dependent receptor plug domain-containing protein n=1 Tax=Alteromonas nitratireducens TaxID=3390813 RepID=UPI0034B87050
MNLKTNLTVTAKAVAACTFFLSSAASAVSDSDDIEHITVSGSRMALPASQLSLSRSVLTRDEIAASGALQVTDLLRGLPGVSIAQSGSPGSLTEIRLRGSESNHLLVLIDGVIANDIGQGSLFDLAHLTTAGIERIELLRGAQSALWGSGGIGGVLSITTRAAGERDTDVSLSAGAGNRDTQTLSASVRGTTGKLGYTVYANAFDTRGDNVARTGTEADGYRNVTAGTSLNYHLSGSQQLDARVRLTDYRNEYDAIDVMTTGLPTDADNQTDGLQVSAYLGWRYAPENSAFSTLVSAQFRRDENDNRQDSMATGGTTGQRHQLTWQSQYQSARWQAALGLDYLQRFFDQRGPVIYGDPNQSQHDTTTSGFAELAGEPVDNWFVHTSARLDNNSQYDDAVSYRAGITWQASPGVAAFVSHGRAVKTPTFTERFGYFPGSFIGNPSLMPETSTEWEAGLRADIGATGMTLSVFDTRLNDEILGYVYLPEAGSATAQNAGSTSQRRGAEVTFRYDSAIATWQAAYTYLDATQEDAGTALTELRRARHQGSLSVTSDLGTDSVSLYTKLSYTGSREDVFYPPYPAASVRTGLRPYTLMSVALRYQFMPQWQSSLRIDNALDAGFEDIVGFQGEQRRVMLTVHYTH